jgi:Fis family transcriptional regulator, factor for inversion stimulation protein
MGRKHAYATKAQLETLVLRMHRTGILYFEALKEFRKQFILVVLREVDWNKSKAARALGMHRSTLVRTLRELNIDIRALRNAERRPPLGIGRLHTKKSAG